MHVCMYACMYVCMYVCMHVLVINVVESLTGLGHLRDEVGIGCPFL